MLDEIERANFLYFWEQAHPETGLVKDRSKANTSDSSIVASIAATGFGLTALCIAEKRGWVATSDARDRVLGTLNFSGPENADAPRLLLSLGQYHERRENLGRGSIVGGHRHFALRHSYGAAAFSIFGDHTAGFGNIRPRGLDLAFRRHHVLPHGWTPEFGFLPYRWDYYSELMMIYLLGLGSEAHPLPQDAWNAWKRTTFEYDGLRYIGSYAPLFVHQYSQAWFDFRGKRDRYADYFKNSGVATDAHRLFCLELGKQFPDYSDDLWGITASDSENGYVVWGGPPEIGPIDGTVAPSAAAGSLPFLPEATLRVLRNIRTRYGTRAWSRYGFVNAFNPLKNWYDSDVIGIDTGITMLMAENLRTGFVWETFMKNPEAQRGLQRAGFMKY